MKKPKTKAVVPKEPRGAQVLYLQTLRALWLDGQTIVTRGLLPILDRWPDRVDALDDDLLRDLRRWMARASGIRGPRPPVPDVVTARSISRQVDWLEIQLGHTIESPALERLINRAARSTEDHARTELGRVLRIDLPRAVPGVREAISTFQDTNVQLIRTGLIRGETNAIQPGMLQSVSDVVHEAYDSGLRVEGLAARLADRFGVSDTRAELIAQDQILKLNAQISETRLRDAGVEEYIWITSRDERVRPEHLALDGTKHRWDDPPVSNKNGEKNNPGTDVRCRCIASPVLPDTFGLGSANYLT